MIKRLLVAASLVLGMAAAARATPTAVAPVAAPAAYAVAPAAVSFVGADSVNGNSFTSSGREVLIVHNTDASSHSITVTSVADALGRTGDSTQTIAAGAYYVFQMFPATGWRQSDGTIHFTANSSLVQVAVIQFP